MAGEEEEEEEEEDGHPLRVVGEHQLEPGLTLLEVSIGVGIRSLLEFFFFSFFFLDFFFFVFSLFFWTSNLL